MHADGIEHLFLGRMHPDGIEYALLHRKQTGFGVRSGARRTLHGQGRTRQRRTYGQGYESIH